MSVVDPSDKPCAQVAMRSDEYPGQMRETDGASSSR